MRLRFGGLYHGNGQRVQYSEALRTEPADFCPVHALPMWWWPSGGEWACQVATCRETKPVAVERTAPSVRVRETWMAGQRMGAMVTNPFHVFNVTGI